jgi:hypothetical protein
LAELRSRDYRDENAASRYPFADGASLRATSGLAIDPATFLDAAVYPVGGRARCGVTAIVVADRIVTIWVGDPPRSRRASGTFDPFFPPDAVHLEDEYGRPAGMFLADPVLLAASQAWPTGTHTFPAGAAELAASCVVPTPEAGLRGFLTEAGDLLTGDVWWVGEHGVVVRDEGGTVRVDVVGDPLFARRLCFPLGVFSTPRFVRTINGIPPGPDGNFQVLVGDRDAPDTALRIYPLSDTTLGVEVVGATLRT